MLGDRRATTQTGSTTWRIQRISRAAEASYQQHSLVSKDQYAPEQVGILPRSRADLGSIREVRT